MGPSPFDTSFQGPGQTLGLWPPISDHEDSDDWKSDSGTDQGDSNDDILVIGIDFGTTYVLQR
jgi:hypothetical protein